MATYIFTGTITVEGGSILTKQDAIDEIQAMLDAHEENDCWGNDIIVHWNKVEKTND